MAQESTKAYVSYHHIHVAGELTRGRCGRSPRPHSQLRRFRPPRCEHHLFNLSISSNAACGESRSAGQDNRGFGERKAQGDPRIVSIKDSGNDHDRGYEVEGPVVCVRSCHSSGMDERDGPIVDAEKERPHDGQARRRSQQPSQYQLTSRGVM